jgi:hypothetical protein
MSWWRKSPKEPGEPEGEQSPKRAVGQGLSDNQLLDRIAELQWQLGWWECNYGHNMIKAPTRRDNEAMMRALAEAERHMRDEDWWSI